MARVTLTLAEAIPLMASMAQHVQRLEAGIREKAIVRFEKGESYTQDCASVEADLAEISKAKAGIRILKTKVSEANRAVTVEIGNGERVSLEYALLLVKDMRREVEMLRMLAALPDKPRAVSSLYEVAACDPEKMRKRADQLERRANRLSVLIDKANMESLVEVDTGTEFDLSPYMDLDDGN